MLSEVLEPEATKEREKSVDIYIAIAKLLQLSSDTSGLVSTSNFAQIVLLHRPDTKP